MTKPHRKRYGLGSFFKKAAKKVKKVVKSPLGKAALLGAGAYFAPQAFGARWGGPGGWGSKLGGLFQENKLLGNLFHTGEGTKRKLSLGKMALMGLGTAGAVMPFLGDDEEEIVEEGWENTPASIASIHQMARDRDPSLSFLPQSPYVQSGFYNAASGGLARLANGGGVAEAKAEQMLKMEYQKYRNQGGTMSYQRFKMMVLQQAQAQGPVAQGPPQIAQPQMAAKGGRIGYQGGYGPAGGASAGGNYGGDSSGGDYSAGAGRSVAQGGQFGDSYDRYGWIPSGTVGNTNLATGDGANVLQSNVVAEPTTFQKFKGLFTKGTVDEDDDQVAGNIFEQSVLQPGLERNKANIAATNAAITEPTLLRDLGLAQGGRVGADEGGLMSLGGMEKDYRQEGGFVPLGKEEKADDVPARLSKNEFVFTADAVKAAGGGDIDAGADVMQNMMNNLEEGGEISEESQGAQGMYNQQQMLQSRMA